MSQGLEHGTGSELLAGVRTALATSHTAQVGPISGREQLALLTEGLRLEWQLHTWLVQLAVQIDTAQVAWQEHGTSTSTWLADAANLTRREAARLIAAGQGPARFGIVAAATASGEVLPAQAVIDSYGAARKRGLDRLDPNTEYVTAAMNRRAARHGRPPRPGSAHPGRGPSSRRGDLVLRQTR
ncbi:MAG: hypothetical protein ACOH1Y_16715, partial [Propionicimonas sp.]